MMTEKEAQTCASVMCRVSSVCTMRRTMKTLKSRPVLTGGTFLTSLTVLAVSISIPKVISNMSNLPGLTNYFIYIGQAFLHTTLLVQIVSVAVLVSSLWFIAGLIKHLNMKNVIATRFFMRTA